MKVNLLLQARTNSSRLPAKVLLPVEGIPLVVLSAKRASNTGHRVIVVTSVESSDDLLCDVLQQWGIEYFRGDLEDTLKRFVDALEGMPDEQLVVRLTGDNVVPDGKFIDEMIDDFTKRELSYLSCVGLEAGLPYGVGVEITRVEYLRDAHRHATLLSDREHVTPKVIRRFGKTVFDRYSDLDMSQFRCTVDTLNDYLRLCRLFKGIRKPEQATLSLLLKLLKEISPEVVSSHPLNRFVLGTAQFGSDYGVANTSGQPAQQKVNEILETALSNGIKYIDTARAYGESEQVLGEALSLIRDSRAAIITKLSPLDDCPVNATTDIVSTYVEKSIYASCRSLRVRRIDTLMLHRASHLNVWHGAVWEKVLELQKAGVIYHLGVSVQSPSEALLALDYAQIEFIQLPFNILDYRWDPVIEKISQVRENRKLVIHARSALLQGLLISDQLDLWSRANCANASEVIDWLAAKAKIYTSGSVTELLLQYVFSQSWLDGVVVGVDTKEQLVDNLSTISDVSWSEDLLRSVISDRPTVSIETLNPAKWRQ